MNDILIGVIIIIICVSVFILMSVLVVGSYNENKKMEELNNIAEDRKFRELDITFTEIDDISVFNHLSKWTEQVAAEAATKQSDAPLTEAQELSLLQALHEHRTRELKAAIEHEDYETATNIRDEIQKINQELKKYEKNI